MENTFCIMNGLKVELRWLIAICHLTTSISLFFLIFFAAILRQTLFLNSAENLNFKEFLTSFRQILKEISFQSLCVLISYSDLVVRFT